MIERGEGPLGVTQARVAESDSSTCRRGGPSPGPLATCPLEHSENTCRERVWSRVNAIANYPFKPIDQAAHQTQQFLHVRESNPPYMPPSPRGASCVT